MVFLKITSKGEFIRKMLGACDMRQGVNKGDRWEHTKLM